MATKRKSIGKKVRFEVFKRDKFACQYCGAKAPDVLLHVDHILPVAKGGTGDILNLITSCETCNAGKSDRELSDDAAVQKRRAQASALQERREQIEMMAAWQASLVSLDDQSVEIAASMFARLVPGRVANDQGKNVLRQAIKSIGLERVLSQLRASAAKHVEIDEEGNATDKAGSAVFHDFEKMTQWAKVADRDPLEADLRYIRGIARNRCGYFKDWLALKLLKEAMEVGGRLEDLREIALDTPNWTNWVADMDRYIEELRARGGQG